MTRIRLIAGMALCVCAASAFAQGQSGVLDPSERVLGIPGSGKGGRDSLRPPSNPGIAEPLDIRIQGEGISLPAGVSEDEPVSKPADDRASQGSAPPENPSQPDPKRP
jgi:hypothetical protein